MGYWNSLRGWGGHTGGDSGNHLEKYSRLGQRLRLFPAPTKNKRVPSFQSNDLPALSGCLNQLFADQALFRPSSARHLTDIDQIGPWFSPNQNSGIHQPVKKNDIGLSQNLPPSRGD